MPMPGICKATKKGSFDEDLAARRGEYLGQDCPDNIFRRHYSVIIGP